MSSYRYMRILVLFDLPTLTAAERKAAARFRMDLIEEGFLMLQESVYCKLALNGTAAALVKSRVRRCLPDDGSVFMLMITEKQFEAMEICLGGYPENVVDSDNRLVII